MTAVEAGVAAGGGVDGLCWALLLPEVLASEGDVDALAVVVAAVAAAVATAAFFVAEVDFFGLLFLRAAFFGAALFMLAFFAGAFFDAAFFGLAFFFAAGLAAVSELSVAGVDPLPDSFSAMMYSCLCC